MSDFDEMGADLDRTLRTTLMFIGQVIERGARRSADRSRQNADRERRAFLEGQAAARRLFLPLTLDARAAEQAAPEVLAAALRAAREWAPMDPVAHVAADHLHKEWTRLYPDRKPEDALGVDERDVARPVQLDADQARRLAEEHAPTYYRLDDVSDAELVSDWTHWSEEGHLPQDTVYRHWARHLHREDEVAQAGSAAVEALPSSVSAEEIERVRSQAEFPVLESIWHESTAIGEDRALELASRFAPVYYSASDSERFVEDWRHFLREGELPLQSRQESWAQWTGQIPELAGLDDEARAEELERMWGEDRAERGALEYAAAVVEVESAVDDLVEDAPRRAEQFTRAGESLSETLPSPEEAVGDREHAAALFRPLLDVEAFAAAEPSDASRAWLAAHVWSSTDPEAAAAADQLDRQYRTRFGHSPEAGMGLGDEVAVTAARVRELTSQAHEFYQARYAGSPAQDYLHGRLGSDVDEQARVALGYAPAGRQLTAHLLEQGATEAELVAAGLTRIGRDGESYDLFRERLMITVRDGEGHPVGFTGRDLTGDSHAPKYLNTPATAVFDKSEVVLGLSEAAGSRIVRVEGGVDVIAINLAGGGAVAGVATMGVALSPTQAKALADEATDGVLVNSLDNDRAGLLATERQIEAMASHGVSVRTLPITAGDPAEQWEENPERLRQALATSPVALRPAGIDLIGRDLDQAAWEHPEDRARAVTTAARHVAAAPAQDQADLLAVLASEYRDSYNGRRPDGLGPLSASAAAEAAATAVRDGQHVWAKGTSWTDALNDVAADMATARAETATSAPAASASPAPYDRAEASEPVESTDEGIQSRQRAGAGFARSTLDGVAAGSAKPKHTPKPKGRREGILAGREDTLGL